MNSIKKMMAKRKLKRNANRIQNAVTKTYKGMAKDMNKRISGIKLPLKVTLTH